MRVLRFVPVAAVALLVLSSLACGSQDGGEAAPRAETPRGEGTPGTSDPRNFTDSATVTNPWFPLKPGTQRVYIGTTQDGEDQIPHRIVFTVTDLTKEINGVKAVVGWDRDYSDGQLVETELIFFAQDRSGNVWHLGEYAEVWEDGELIGGQTWLVGHLAGAKAGIMMPANPRTGTPAYQEGFAPAPFNWNDWGKVAKTGQRTCVPYRCFNGVTVIDEFEPSKPNAFQTKWYARGVGLVRVGWKGKDADHEVLQLKQVLQLTGSALAKARTEALKLETRANVYGSTPAAKQRTTQ